MSNLVSVREHAWLTTDALPSSVHPLDWARVSETAFAHLCRLSESFNRSGAKLAQLEGRHRLKLDNYVGVIQTPCGTAVEIVPKHHDVDEPLADSRRLLRKMVQAQLELPSRSAGEASLALFDAPLTEWVMRRFLQELEGVVLRGLRFDYVRVEEETTFLRSQLDMRRQLNQRPGKAHHFHIRHDVYLPDRPENRLLKLALERVRQATRDAANWRLASELSVRLAELVASRNVQADLKAWRRDRLMAHYAGVRPWCELILREQMPLAVAGEHRGLSLLFPMERLFEGYVASWLARRLGAGFKLACKPASEYLCAHGGEPMFRLEPDLLVSGGGQRWVIDTKWKRIDQKAREQKYGIQQADLYQLFAYGQTYLAGAGRMALVYPKTVAFNAPLGPFAFSSELELLALPFDLDEEFLLGSEELGLEVATLGSK